MELIITSKIHGVHVVYYDEQDQDLINGHNWVIHKADRTFYVRATLWDKELKKSKYAYMHRLIINAMKGQQVDHKDRNGLNNKRNNLRLCNNSQNNANKPAKTTNKTGYRGVHFNKIRKRYMAYLFINGKRIFGGYFKKVEDAAIKYNELSLKYHGEFAWLNKIPE